MKILINAIGIKPLFYKKGGAIQKLVSYQVCSLKDENEITIVGQMARNEAGIHLIHCRRVPSISLLRNYLLHGLLGLPRIWHVDADIVISTHPRNFLSSFLYSKLKGKPMMAWEMDHVFWTPPITTVKKFYYCLAKRTHRLIAISSVQKRRIMSQGINSNKIALIYGAIDTRKFSPLDNRDVGTKEKESYILYVAKFTERKNHLALLRAFKKVIDRSNLRYPNLKLYLVGPTTGAFTSKSERPSPYYRKCLEYIQESSLEGRVKLYDDMSDAELIELYSHATLFVFPSLEEGFGMTLLEAMACGCPCIVNDIEPPSEILGTAGPLVNMEKPGQLADKIEALLENESLRKQLGTLARQRAVSVFDSNIIGERFKAVLEEIVSET